MKLDENGHEVLANESKPESDLDASNSDDSEDTKYAKGVRRSNRYQPSRMSILQSQASLMNITVLD